MRCACVVARGIASSSRKASHVAGARLPEAISCAQSYVVRLARNAHRRHKKETPSKTAWGIYRLLCQLMLLSLGFRSGRPGCRGDGAPSGSSLSLLADIGVTRQVTAK
jgi:hypothetical protein